MALASGEGGARLPHGDATPIAILAGGGTLPLDIANALRDRGAGVHLTVIEGAADADFSDYDTVSIGIGQTGKMINALSRDGAKRMVLAGTVKRPDLSALKIDLGFVRHLPTILGLLRGGDDHLLRKVASFFERQGLVPVGIADVAPELLTGEGALGRGLSPMALEQVPVAFNVLHKLAPYDVGQAIVVSGKRVVAIEGAEGTEGLLGRIARDGRTCDPAQTVLLKTVKPGQDLRFDLPTIGPDTPGQCAAAGVGAVVLGAGVTLIAARAATRAQGEAENVAIAGVRVPRQHVGASVVGDGSFVCLGRRQPSHILPCDSQLGLNVLASLADCLPTTGVIVSHEQVLAIGIDETPDALAQRAQALRQWGRRKRRGGQGVLALSDCDVALVESVPQLAEAGLAGIALDACPANVRPSLVAAVDRHGLCLMSRAPV